MKKNLSLKTLFNKSNILKSLFYFFPIIMLCSSGYITAYVTFLTIFSLYYFLSNKIKIRIFKNRELFFLLIQLEAKIH